jgi:sugar lactone lactonase YvrE
MKTSLGISSRRIFVGIALLSLTLAARAAAGYNFATFAGSPLISGHVNATGSAASFDGPNGLVLDASGNLYVSDYSNNQIRKVTPAGVVTTFAGSATGTHGSANGTGTAASFYSPGGLAIDGAGNIYVADSYNNAIRKITPGGVVTTFAGLAGTSGSTDATGTAARFNSPLGVAVDGSGNVLVADTTNDTIRSITPAGVVSTIAGSAGSSGSTDSTGTAARFNTPFGVAVDASGNIFVADSGNHLIRKIAPGGVVTTLAGTAGVSGSIDATGTAAKFNTPYSLAVDASGNVYVADYHNDTIRLVTPAGVVTTLAGVAQTPGSANGVGTGALFFNPAAVALGNSNNILYVADYSNDTIRKGRLFPIVDFNGDGQADILWENTVTGAREVWLMTGATLAGYAGLPTQPTAWHMAAADDFNGDGQTDILWENTTTGEREIWLLNGTNLVGYATLPTVPIAWHIAGTGDFNSDGQTDILWENTVTGEREIWLMNGTEIAGYALLPTEPLAWRIAGAADFNGDGQTDILWENTTTGEREIWLMNGTEIAGYALLPTEPLAWRIAGTDDFNGDGQADILWENTTTGEREVWLMNGTTIADYASLGTVPLAWRIAGSDDFNGSSISGKPDDFNGDGHADILWENTVTGEREIWLMNGTVIAGYAFLPTEPLAWHIVGTGDFNSDGQTDIVWENTTTGEHEVWLMNASGILDWAELGVEPLSWRIAGTADFNGDGQTDILWENTTTGEREIWLMNGTTIAGYVGLGTVPVAWHIVGTDDFNEDGHEDILWENTATGEREIWLMNGTTIAGYAGLPTVPVEWHIAR